MFDGVGWAAAEIVWFMIVATLIGFAIGWIFGRWLLRGVISEAYEVELDQQEELARKAEHRLIESNNTLDKLQEQLRAESEQVGELDAQLRSTRETVEDLQAELAAAGGSDEAFVQIKAQRDAAREETAEKLQVIDGLREQLGVTEANATERVEHLTAQLDAAHRSISELEQRVEAAEQAAVAVPDLRGGLESAHAGARELSDQVVDLESDLEGARARISQLEAQLGEARESAAAVPDLQGELGRAQQDAHDLSERVAGLKTELDGAEGRVGELEAQLEEARQTASEVPGLVAGLEECASARAALSARVEELETELAAMPRREPTKEEARGLITEVAARTAGGMVSPDDDLKQIRGIGPKLEAFLKGLGITSFRQVANLQPEDIAVITAALGTFKGRIERDDWVGGAAEQHLRKYNEPA